MLEDQVVAEGEMLENEDDESFFQDVDLLQSHGIVSKFQVYIFSMILSL